MTMAFEAMQGGLSAGTAQAMGGAGATLASTGSVQGDGAVPKVSINIVSGADGTKGVTLPALSLGDELWIFNNSASTLKVYPPTGSAIAVPGTGLGTANSAFSHLTYKTVVYKCQSSTQIFPLVTA